MRQEKEKGRLKALETRATSSDEFDGPDSIRSPINKQWEFYKYLEE